MRSSAKGANIGSSCAFQDVDWCELVGADEVVVVVVVVVTPVLLREMDQHKDRKRGVLQSRARRWNGWLGDLRRSKRWAIRPNVRVEVSVREPEPHARVAPSAHFDGLY